MPTGTKSPEALLGLDETVPVGTYSRPMRLEAFLRQPDWTEQRLADEVQRVLGRKLEVSPSTICRLKRGNGRRTQRTASVSLALAIERATGGVVRAEELPLTRTSRRLLRDLRPTAERDSAGASAA